MSRFTNAISAFLTTDTETIQTKTKKRPSGAIDVSTPEDRIKMDMNKLVAAAETAILPSRPDRRDLVAIYTRSEKDAHVISQFEICKSKLIGEPFVVSKGGVEDEDLTAMLKKPWFEEFVKICFEAEMWGYTICEFGQVKNGDWSEVITFPRRHVEPFSRNILVRPGDVTGVPYGDKPEALFLLELGKPKDLGRLEIISREVIWKNFARTDWSQASEKFGMPVLSLKTDCDDPKELDRMEAMCANFSRNGYIISRTDDTIEILSSKATDFYRIFEVNARFCDEQISKCVNGQTSSSDQKAYVGAAQVHEGIQDDFHSARLRHLSNIVNYTLFPFLEYHGRNLTDCTFRFPSLDVISTADQNNSYDPEADPNMEPSLRGGTTKQSLGVPGDPQKKKPVTASLKYPSWVSVMPAE